MQSVFVTVLHLEYPLMGLKGNITFVCAHTANAAWFFPAIIVVISNVTQKCQRHISRLFVGSGYCQLTGNSDFTLKSLLPVDW